MRKAEGPAGIEGRTKPLTTLLPDAVSRGELDDKSPAALVLEGARMLIAGASFAAIAAIWNRAGYPSPRGKAWQASVIQRTLGNPALAGYLVYRGEVARDDQGEPIRPFQPLYDDDIWGDVQAAIAARRASSSPRRANNETLLTGLLRCGACGRRLCSDGKRRSYICPTVPGSRRCLGISMPKLDALVVEAAMCLLDDPQLLAVAQGAPRPPATTDDVDAAVEESQRQLEVLEAMKLAGEFSGDAGAQRYARHSGRLHAALDEALAAQASAARRRRRGPTVKLAGPNVRTAFATLPYYAKRTLLGELIDHIAIQPSSQRRSATPGTFGRRFEPERVGIVWRTQQ